MHPPPAVRVGVADFNQTVEHQFFNRLCLKPVECQQVAAEGWFRTLQRLADLFSNFFRVIQRVSPSPQGGGHKTLDGCGVVLDPAGVSEQRVAIEINPVINGTQGFHRYLLALEVIGRGDSVAGNHLRLIGD